MSSKKEKLIIENLISSKDIFSRCISLIESKYFEPELRSTVTFLISYFNKYKAVPTPEVIKAETDIDLSTRTITNDQFEYTCDSIEEFCQNCAMQEAILASADELQKATPNRGKITELVKKALAVSLPKDMGLEFYDNPEAKLTSFLDTTAPMPTGIAAIDTNIDGGPRRSTLTLFSANSGVGKSVMLANLGVNYSKMGYRVLYISLELPEPMIYLRLSSIATEMNIKEWKENIPEMAFKINKLRDDGAGSYIVKRAPNGATANDLRSIVKLYELEFGCVPDVLIVDYLDLMSPNDGARGRADWEQDKDKAEQLYELLFEIDAVGLSASQQNRGALDNPAPNQGVIAGGMAKVNTVDNYISLYMDPQMRLMGTMRLAFLKTRSSDGVGRQIEVAFHPTTLIINDKHGTTPSIVVQNKKKKSRADEILAGIVDPSLEKNDKKKPEKQELSVANDSMEDMKRRVAEMSKLAPEVIAQLEALNPPPIVPKTIEETAEENGFSLDDLVDRNW